MVMMINLLSHGSVLEFKGVEAQGSREVTTEKSALPTAL